MPAKVGGALAPPSAAPAPRPARLPDSEALSEAEEEAACGVGGRGGVGLGWGGGKDGWKSGTGCAEDCRQSRYQMGTKWAGWGWGARSADVPAMPTCVPRTHAPAQLPPHWYAWVRK